MTNFNASNTQIVPYKLYKVALESLRNFFILETRNEQQGDLLRNTYSTITFDQSESHRELLCERLVLLSVLL